MQRHYVPLLYLILAVTQSAISFKLSAKLNEDAVDLALLFEKFWSLKPHAFEKTTPINVCPFIDRCCSNEHRRAAMSTWIFAIFGEVDKRPTFDQVLNKCMNSTLAKDSIESCPSIETILLPDLTKHDQSDMKLFMYTISDYLLQLNQIFIPAINTCTDEEIHAYICLTNTTLVTQCVERILHGMYDMIGYESYDEFINEIRKNVLNLIVKLYTSTNGERQPK